MSFIERRFKFTTKEQKQVDVWLDKINQHRLKISKLEASWNKKEERQQLKQNKIDYEIKKLTKKIYDYEAKVIKRCKHKSGTYRVRNYRDDASFDYWVRCDDCHETIRSE